MSSLPERERAVTSPVDAQPTLWHLVASEVLAVRLQAFVGRGVLGISVYAPDGARFVVSTAGPSTMAGWATAPDRVHKCLRAGAVAFEHDGTPYEAHEIECGGELVGFVVYQLVRAGPIEHDEVVAIHGMLDLVLSSGYARWITTQVHEAVSEGSYRAMQQQNSDLQRAVDHLREVDGLKSSFLATVSHELRTPLTSVIGFSEMLLKGLAGPLNAEQTEYVSTVLERGEELLQLISSLLEISRLEVGAVDLIPEAMIVSELVARARRAVEILATRANLGVQIEISGMPQVRVDPHKIHQVLVNLLSNAFKFSRAGGNVRVSACTAPLRRPFTDEAYFGSEQHDAVKISVADDGVGIVSDRLERIFEPFYQVDGTLTRQHGGAGLGLAISKKLVEAHGGEIWAESEPGRGTRFHFTVPLIPENPEQ